MYFVVQITVVLLLAIVFVRAYCFIIENEEEIQLNVMKIMAAATALLIGYLIFTK